LGGLLNHKFNIKDVHDSREFKDFDEEVKTWIFDPPYNIGFTYNNIVNDKLSTVKYKKFIETCCERMFDTWCDDANMFLIIYPETAARLLPTIESTGWKFKQWISWVYPSNMGHSKHKFTRAHRAVVWFTKGDPKFNHKAIVQPYREDSKKTRAMIAKGQKGAGLYDYWEINLRKNVSSGYVGYYNQLPKKLIENIILHTTNSGDMVGDITAGGGSTYEVSKEHNRDSWLNDINSECMKIWESI